MASIKDDDILLLHREGVDYQITAKDLYDYTNAFPWRSWIGGIFHVIVDDPGDIASANNYVKHVIDLATSQDVNSIKYPGEFIILTEPRAHGVFAWSPGSWEFGEYTDTSEVTSMNDMFKDTNFRGKLNGNWDTSKVTSFHCTFQGATVPSEVSDWDMSSAQALTYMFWGCTFDADPDLRNWNTSNVESMTMIFESCKNFNQDLSKWDVSNVQSYKGFDDGCDSWADEHKPVWKTRSKDSEYVELGSRLIPAEEAAAGLAWLKGKQLH